MSNTHALTRALAATAVAGLAVGLLVTAPAHAGEPSKGLSAVSVADGGDQGPSVAYQLAAGPQIKRSEVIRRAASWVGRGLVYDGGGTYEGYRRDCSGYASMAWSLGKPGLDTTSYVPSGVASWIDKSDLKPGDALLNDAAGALGHIAIFAGWTDSSKTSYDAYEFTKSGVQHKAIPYPYFSGHGTFRPVRNNSIVDDAVASGPDNVGVFRPSTGEFHLRYDNGSLAKVAWGQSGDLPVSANWDGAGPDNVGVFRPSTGEFHLRYDNGSLAKVAWGQSGDLPVSANWDGAGPDNVGVFRPSTGEFHLRMDNGSLTKIAWGQSGDQPVSGNWDGGAAANVGVFRPSTGEFHLRMDNGSLTKIAWGQSGDLPVTANWDGAGPDNIGIFRPSTGEFHLRMDNGSLTKVAWGAQGDLPVSANWDANAG
ncbi:hypothetical protein ACFYM0_24225 [Streptomyces sp. NPDC006487]|uniref:hypothetical protein n=1 Tax=Streptomyces sp. NPDC006487 TaxID=3364748 RepID=UPI0036CF4EB2